MPCRPRRLVADQEKKPGSGVPPLLIAVLAVAFSLIAKQFELMSARPPATDTPLRSVSELQTIPARLWQDPLAAAESQPRPEATNAQAPWSSVREVVQTYLEAQGLSLESPRVNVNVVGVMVFGGPHSEDAERRRRTRYAVAAGMLESDFVPWNAERLGLLQIPLAQPHLPKLDIPFEWFQCSPAQPDRPKCEPGSYAVVLWLNDDAFAYEPLERLAAIYDSADPRVRKTLIGPAGSGTLISMATEMSRTNTAMSKADPAKTPPDHFDALRDLRIFSASATIAPADLFASIPDGSAYPATAEGVRSLFRGQPGGPRITFTSTIGTDEQLAELLVEETTLRQYAPMCLLPKTSEDPLKCLATSQILLIAEADTVYARKLTNAFVSRLLDYQCPSKGTSCRARVYDEINWLTYLRGLDGETLKVQSDKEAKRDTTQDAAGKSTAPAAPVKPSEVAGGNSQYDYMRRLADDAKSIERNVSSSAYSVVRAIGIFGSDVYDKLVIMQALRPLFPNAFFFTTDLDARFMQKEQFPWARNLVVASPYGLELAWNIQTDFGPFRDAYQSAQFLAARLALEDPNCDALEQELLPQLLGAPRLFEISRNGAEQLQTSASYERADGPLLRSMVDSSFRPFPPVPVRDAAPDEPRPEGLNCPVTYPWDDKTKHLSWEPIKRLHPAAKGGSDWGAVSKASLALLLLLALYSRTARHATKVATSAWWPYRWQLAIGGAAAAGLATPGWYALIPVALALVLAFLDWRRKTLRPQPAILRWLATLGAALAVLLIAVAWIALTRPSEEPVGWFNGASSWPSEGFRALALAFNIGAIAFVFRTLAKNAADIEGRFFPNENWPKERGSFRLLFTSEFKEIAPIYVDENNKRYLEPMALWRYYRELCNPSHLAIRASAATLLLVLIFLFLSAYVPPVPPVRGVWSTLLDMALLFLSMISLFWLFFLSVDVVRLTAKFADYQAGGITKWPTEQLPSMKVKDRTLVDRALRDRLDLELIAARTAGISWVIILPFIPCLLVVLARNEIVDAWPWPWPIVALFVLLFSALIVMAVRLRTVADDARQKVQERIAKAHERAILQADTNAAAYLESVAKSLDSISAGAFAPALRAEWLQGLAIPTTGYGLLELLRSYLG